jgi:hypothetical protein
MAKGVRSYRRSAAPRSDGPASKRSHVAQAANTELPEVRANFSESNIVRAVVSLYDDELRPYSRILKKRLAEHAGIQETEAKNIDVDQLCAQCEGSVHLNVTNEEGGEWSALLIGRAPEFIDIYDEIDVYSKETWTAAETYFRVLGDSEDNTLPGGRYATAYALATRHLSFLAGFTLGRICHFTQIAITQRKLLGYANGRIVPFSCSQSVVKAQFAAQQLPHVGPTVSKGNADLPAFPVADWTAARSKLQDILATAVHQGLESVALSNVKRLFRSTYRLELSETALGYSRLTDLLRDERFRDICKVQLQDRGYVILPTEALGTEGGVAHSILGDLPVKGQALDVVSGSTLVSAADAQNTFLTGGDSMPNFCPDEPLCLEDVHNPTSPATAPFPFPTPSPQYSYGNSTSFNACTWDRGQPFCPLGMVRSSTRGQRVCEENTLWTKSDWDESALGMEEPRIASKQLFCPDEPLDMEAVHQGVPKTWMSPAPCAAWTPSPHYSTRSFLPYQVRCTDVTGDSAMPHVRSRSTSVESRSLVFSDSGASSSSNDGDHGTHQFASATGHHDSHNVWLTVSSSGTFDQESEAACEAECQGHQTASYSTLAVDLDAASTYQLPMPVPPPPLSAPVLDGMLQQVPTSSPMPEGFPALSTSHAAIKHGPTTLSISSLVGANSLGSEAHIKGTCNPCAHFHSRKGCTNAGLCSFCHHCPPGELKRRQKAKKRLMPFAH